MIRTFKVLIKTEFGYSPEEDQLWEIVDTPSNREVVEDALTHEVMFDLDKIKPRPVIDNTLNYTIII